MFCLRRIRCWLNGLGPDTKQHQIGRFSDVSLTPNTRSKKNNWNLLQVLTTRRTMASRGKAAIFIFQLELKTQKNHSSDKHKIRLTTDMRQRKNMLTHSRKLGFGRLFVMNSSLQVALKYGTEIIFYYQDPNKIWVWLFQGTSFGHCSILQDKNCRTINYSMLYSA